ncbi:helix-turn-helix domain-containing protein [Streptacidiphilus melanogenes]|uniref:helix-turn-helix domain-containing protein n=1 Tax=Streptacidiphilus melanogenes TaxID=411235 RepID=UPI001F3A3884|nr:helix-turn-helix domain-containing protein [Streptacidiphilus melanogenes]
MTTPARPSGWGPARQRQALDMAARYRHGATVRELATATGLSPSTVLNRLRMVDTPMRTQQQTLALRQGPDRARLANRLRTTYQGGATVTALAERHGLSARTVRRLLREAGTVLRSSAETRTLNRAGHEAERQQQMDELRRWYEAGVSVPALAAVHECSPSTVYRLLHRAGTVLRPHGRTITGPATAPP